jgi:hypothetical protein
VRLKPPYDERYALEDSLGTGAQGARALASVVHPSLPRFHELHADHDPPLLVMEAVEGTDLRDMLATGRTWTPEELAPLGQALAEGLAMLHAKGVVHRDLKPENVMLAEGGPRLLDLGLAQLDGEERITRTGAAVGTPLYFAPEQFQKRPSTKESDVFSLGVILYEMLMGERPFALLDLTQYGRTGRLTRRPQERLSAALGRAAGRCLEPDPRARPDAEELAVALRLGDAWDTRETQRPQLAEEPAPRGSRGRLLALAVTGVALGAWLAGGPRAPELPSLNLRPVPGGVEASWQGSPSDRGLELVVEGGARVPLPASAGLQRLHVPLSSRARVRLMRGARGIAAGAPPRDGWELSPAPVPPATATRLLRTPEGLALTLDSEAWPWAPERVEVRNGPEEREVARRLGEGPARYPLAGPLDGDVPLEIWPLTPSPGGGWNRIGDAPWLRWDGSVQQRPVLIGSEGKGRLGPVEPALQEDYELVRLPHILLGSRTFSSQHLAASRKGTRRLWFPVIVNKVGYVVGRKQDPQAPLEALRISPEPVFFPPTSQVLDLGRSLVFYFHEKPALDDPGVLWVWRGGGPPQRTTLGLPFFVPIASPFPTGDGRAFLLGRRLRTRIIDEDGRIGLPLGLPTVQGYRVRRGDQRSGERWLALALHGPPAKPPRHALLLVDRQTPTRRTLVEGLPSAPPSHPLVLEKGPHAGLYVILEDRIQRIALEHLIPAPGEEDRHTTMEELVKSRAIETVLTLGSADPGANLIFPRAHPLSGERFGILPFAERVEVPGKNPKFFLGQPVAFRRFRALLLGEGEPEVVDLDRGPFPGVPTGIPQVAGSLDGRRGLAALLADGHGTRAALELWDVVSHRPLIRWDLRVNAWALSPTLLGDHIFMGVSPGMALEASLPPLGTMSP